MAELFKILGQINPGAANTTLYTCPAQTQTVVSCLSVCNTTSGSVTIRIYVVPDKGTAAVANAFMYDRTLTANLTIDVLKGICLRAGDSIVCYASATNVIFHLFGSEIS